MRKLVSAATSLVMAATMVSAVAPVVAGAADAKKGLSILTYKEATLPSGVTADGATVNVSADAIKAGDVTIPLAIYLSEETPDTKGISVQATVNSKNADVKNIKFQSYKPGADPYFSEPKTFTTKDGTVQSRIKPTLDNGSIVTDTRANVHYFVTEYGIVNLKGLSSWQKAEAIISVAHPDFRDSLIQEAEKLKIWKKSNKR